jgi:hypothetical protein
MDSALKRTLENTVGKWERTGLLVGLSAPQKILVARALEGYAFGLLECERVDQEMARNHMGKGADLNASFSIAASYGFPAIRRAFDSTFKDIKISPEAYEGIFGPKEVEEIRKDVERRHVESQSAIDKAVKEINTEEGA